MCSVLMFQEYKSIDDSRVCNLCNFFLYFLCMGVGVGVVVGNQHYCHSFHCFYQ